jgi:hypothetical protein
VNLQAYLCCFVLHETSDEGNSNWHSRFWKDEELHLYEKRCFYKGVSWVFQVEEETKFSCDLLFFVVSCVHYVLDRLQCLVALDGRMPKGVSSTFMKDKLFMLCLASFNLMQLNTGCRNL